MRKGFTLLEVLVSVGMLMTIVATIYPTVAWLTTRSKRLQFDAQAANVLQEGMEAAYNVFLANWDQARVKYPEAELYVVGFDASTSPSTWDLVPSASPEIVEGRFKRWIAIEKVCRKSDSGEQVDCAAGNADDNSRLVKVSVEWQDRNEVTKTVSAKLMLVDL